MVALHVLKCISWKGSSPLKTHCGNTLSYKCYIRDLQVGHKISLEYLKTNQAVVRLKEILRAEHNAMLDFICTTIKQVGMVLKLPNPVLLAMLCFT